MRICFLVAVASFMLASCQHNVGPVRSFFRTALMYSDGNLTNKAPWAAHSGGGTNPVQVSSGTIVLNGTGEDVYAPVGVDMGAGEVWTMSFDVTVSGIGAGTTYLCT